MTKEQNQRVAVAKSKSRTHSDCGGTLRELHKVRRKTDYIMLMLLDMVLQATES